VPILDYWTKKNQSSAYSKKLNQLFKTATLLLVDHPKIGRPTDHENVRIKIIKDYFLFYEETDTEIYILTVWDSRQDPKRLLG